MAVVISTIVLPSGGSVLEAHIVLGNELHEFRRVMRNHAV
jgi:hypothetical protein